MSELLEIAVYELLFHNSYTAISNNSDMADPLKGKS